MKKIATIGTAAFCLVALASCSNDNGKPLAEFENINETDSLSYYMGEYQAVDYWKMAEQDTLLLDDAAREAYIKGLEKGMSMGAGNERAYLMGLMTGLGMTLNDDEMKATLDFSVNKDMFSQGLRYAMQSDSIAKASDAEKQATAMQEKMLSRNLDKGLAETAKARGMKDMGDHLYGATAPKGEKVGKDDNVFVTIEMSDVNGKNIPYGFRNREISLAQVPDDDIVKKMVTGTNYNEPNEFVSTAHNVFGGQEGYMNMKPGEVIVFKVTVKKAGAATDTE